MPPSDPGRAIGVLATSRPKHLIVKAGSAADGNLNMGSVRCTSRMTGCDASNAPMRMA